VTPERSAVNRSTYINHSRPIAVWLLACCVLVYVMVVLGGVTRLTRSGLSIVEWDPIMGIIPPLSEPAWQDVFDKYKQFPEYQKVNQGMSLGEFKGIFYVEYAHRLLGRLIGVVFLVPLLYFWLTKRITRALVPKLFLLFVLGGAQGLLGWYMVKSGLIDNPHVSPYRLTAHLLLAVLIYAYMFWTAMTLLQPGMIRGRAGNSTRHYAGVVTVFVLLMIASGGFVAGTRAGFTFNTFPFMYDRWFPQGMWVLEPGWRNFFETQATVQFIHRHFAYLLVVLVLMLWWVVLRTAPTPLRARAHLLPLALFIQVGLGIATLVHVVPVPLAAAHQAGALLVLTAVLWLWHGLRYADGVDPLSRLTTIEYY